jgi:hypothetical protein
VLCIIWGSRAEQWVFRIAVMDVSPFAGCLVLGPTAGINVY